MFFYSPHGKHSTASLGARRLTIAHSSHLNVGHLDTRLSYQIPEILSRNILEATTGVLSVGAGGLHAPEELRIEDVAIGSTTIQSRSHIDAQGNYHFEICGSPVDSIFSPSNSRRDSRRLFLRRPTISINEDGKIVIGITSSYPFALRKCI